MKLTKKQRKEQIIAIRAAINQSGGKATKLARALSEKMGEPVKPNIIYDALSKGVLSFKYIEPMHELTGVSKNKLNPIYFKAEKTDFPSSKPSRSS